MTVGNTAKLAQEVARRTDSPMIEIARTEPLGISVDQVNVKATTEEGLGFTGSGEGISSQAVCLLTTPMGLSADIVMERGCSGCSGCPQAKEL